MMSDIAEEDEEKDIIDKQDTTPFKDELNATVLSSNVNQEANEEMQKLRRWVESFVFKNRESIFADGLRKDCTKKNLKVYCEGCQTKIEFKERDRNRLIPQYTAGEGSKRRKFIFCDAYCETLRKYKEAIRQYAFEYEFEVL